MRLLPITLKTHEVLAILDNRKSMKRIEIKPQPSVITYNGTPFKYKEVEVMDEDLTAIKRISTEESGPYGDVIKAPYQPGDILYVRETWKPKRFAGKILDGFDYKADHVAWLNKNGHEFTQGSGCEAGERWRSPIHMPKEAARIFLEVTDLRAERLGDISADDARAEGAPKMKMDHIGWFSHKVGFESLWQSINGKWNPDLWVWVVTFKQTSKPFRRV